MMGKDKSLSFKCHAVLLWAISYCEASLKLMKNIQKSHENILQKVGQKEASS